MRRLRTVVLIISVLLLAFSVSSREAATQSAPTPAYGITDLGADRTPLGIDPEYTIAIAGFQGTSTHEAFAYAYGQIRPLGTLGGANSEAWAFSWAGTVGRAQTATGAYHAFLDDGKTLVDLGTLGGTHSYATGVTLTTVVGASLLEGDVVTQAFSYDISRRTMEPVPATLGGPNTVANGINESGDVVGRADLPGGAMHHAFVFANGMTTDLGSLGTNSEAYAINASGVVVGGSQLANGNQHAFRYEAGVIRDLGTLGGAQSEARAINLSGHIVGWSQTATGARRAFLWHDGTMTDLNSLIASGTGWVLEAATGISNNGAIVGYGTLAGRRHGFLLTLPVDLSLRLRYHGDIYPDTNLPNPHETGKEVFWGASVESYSVTNLTFVVTLVGPVEFVSGSVFTSGGRADCRQDGTTLTCRFPYVESEAHVYYSVRSTSAGEIAQTVTVTADQPDPNPADNTGYQTNTAVSLASLTLAATTVVGSKNVLGRTTLISPAPLGDARVTLASSNPAVASVPSPFDVQRGCCDGGMWREFYVTTRAVSAPVTVQISATYGLVTKVVPLTIVPNGVAQGPYGATPRPAPGVIQAEDFDEGGEGAAYHDGSPGNSGRAYRSTDVDLEPTRDVGGGVNVGWVAAGEWLEYTIEVATTGTYALEARVASPATGGAFHVELDGLVRSGSIAVPNTGGWQAWATVTRAVTLEAGRRILRVAFDANASSGAVGNFNYFRLTFVSVAPESTPFGGTPRSLPGTIQAEDFDDGGEGVGYHDTTRANSGGQYRATGVDIERTTDGGGGYNVGWIAAEEWLVYSVNVDAPGTYTFTARVASNGWGGAFHVEVGGVDVTGPLTIPNTGGWQRWVDVRAIVVLPAGAQRMKIVADRIGLSEAVANFNHFTFEAEADIVLYARQRRQE